MHDTAENQQSKQTVRTPLNSYEQELSFILDFVKKQEALRNQQRLENMSPLTEEEEKEEEKQWEEVEAWLAEHASEGPPPEWVKHETLRKKFWPFTAQAVNDVIALLGIDITRDLAIACFNHQPIPTDLEVEAASRIDTAKDFAYTYEEVKLILEFSEPGRRYASDLLDYMDAGYDKLTRELLAYSFMAADDEGEPWFQKFRKVILKTIYHFKKKKNLEVVIEDGH